MPYGSLIPFGVNSIMPYKDCTIIGWAAMGGSPASCVFDGCTIKDNGTYGVIRTYFNAEIKDCTFDVDGANPNDAYQDGIHSVGATIQVKECTNVNGDMKDIIDVSSEGFIYIDDELALAPDVKIGDTYYPTLAGAVAAAQSGDTIVIYSNLDELATLVNDGTTTFKGLTVKLGADIDLKGKEWTPIGNSANKFQGIFDGGDHTISNLVITGNNSNVGLFGFTTNGEIKNLTVENASVSGRLNVGVVAGTPYTSKYTNITVKGHVEVNGMSYVGGVGGKNAYANWTNITVDVDDTSYVKAVSTENGTAYRTYVGGVIGFMGEGSHTVENVTSNIDVIGDVCDVGGIVGIAHYGNNFKNVKCSGSVTNTNTNLEDAAETGGIAGVWHNQQGQKVTFENCEYIGDSNVALVGAAYNANDTTEKNSGSLVIDGNTSWPSEARIGMTGYESFEEAVAEAKDGDIVTLVNDAELDTPITIKNNITIDGNGHKITQSAECNNNIALLYFEGSADNVLNVTVKNATFDGLKVGAAIRTLYANMDVDNCVFQNCEHTVGQGLVRLTYGTANITNSKFLNNNCSMGISFNWDGAGLATDTLTVDNCEFTDNTANKTALIYYVKGAGCEIKNSKFVDNDVNTANNCAVIYLGFQENCSVTGCLFEDNTVVDSSTSTRVAGAIFFGYEAEISGNAFINNTASNANGDALGQICTSTYYECEINLSENYFGGQAPVEGKDYYIQHKTGDGEFVLNNYHIVNEYKDNPTIIVYYTTNNSDPTIDSADRKSFTMSELGPEEKLTQTTTVKTVYFSACGKASGEEKCTACSMADYKNCPDYVYGEIGEYKYPVPTKTTVTVGGGGGGGTKVVDNTRKYTKDIFGNEHPTHIGYINGYPDGSVKPEGDITREEITSILYRITNHAYEKPFVATGDAFPDVEAGRWSAHDIEYMADKEIVYGYPDGEFKPSRNLSRAEFAALIFRFTGIEKADIENPFTDLDETHWAYDEILALTNSGLIEG